MYTFEQNTYIALRGHWIAWPRKQRKSTVLFLIMQSPSGKLLTFREQEKA